MFFICSPATLSFQVAVKGSNYSIVLDDLEPSTQYKVIVVAVLESRTNVTSETVYAQTYGMRCSREKTDSFWMQQFF